MKKATSAESVSELSRARYLNPIDSVGLSKDGNDRRRIRPLLVALRCYS
jgi:hypothetical protein